MVVILIVSYNCGLTYKKVGKFNLEKEKDKKKFDVLCDEFNDQSLRWYAYPKK